MQDACDLAYMYTTVQSVRMCMQKHSSPMSTTTRCMGRFAAAVPLRAVIESERYQLSAPKCACLDGFDAGDLRLSDRGRRLHSNTPDADYRSSNWKSCKRSAEINVHASKCHRVVVTAPCTCSRLVMCCSWRKHVRRSLSSHYPASSTRSLTATEAALCSKRRARTLWPQVQPQVHVAPC